MHFRSQGEGITDCPQWSQCRFGGTSKKSFACGEVVTCMREEPPSKERLCNIHSVAGVPAILRFEAGNISCASTSNVVSGNMQSTLSASGVWAFSVSNVYHTVAKGVLAVAGHGGAGRHYPLATISRVWLPRMDAFNASKTLVVPRARWDGRQLAYSIIASDPLVFPHHLQPLIRLHWHKESLPHVEFANDLQEIEASLTALVFIQ
ncbi:hypothetical protein BDQ17DRAFT_1411487 [Cyathus striatus]|nr:hypothetical protein BDQ17DRAFT_1411487 [Cyathus striatus]